MLTLPSITKTRDAFKRMSRDVRYLVLNRVSRCDGCSFKRQQTATGTILASPINNPRNSFCCGIIGKSLLAFASEPEHRCPATNPKWTEVVAATLQA